MSPAFKRRWPIRQACSDCSSLDRNNGRNGKEIEANFRKRRRIRLQLPRHLNSRIRCCASCVDSVGDTVILRDVRSVSMMVHPLRRECIDRTLRASSRQKVDSVASAGLKKRAFRRVHRCSIVSQMHGTLPRATWISFVAQLTSGQPQQQRQGQQKIMTKRLYKLSHKAPMHWQGKHTLQPPLPTPFPIYAFEEEERSRGTTLPRGDAPRFRARRCALVDRSLVDGWEHHRSRMHREDTWSVLIRYEPEKGVAKEGVPTDEAW